MLIKSVLAPTKTTLLNKQDSMQSLFSTLFSGSLSIYCLHFDVIVHDFARTRTTAVAVGQIIPRPYPSEK